jgi:cyclic dehypoxanthinyl futalosine synthase
MDLVRRAQDRSISDFGLSGGGRYVSFISWPFQSDNSPLGRVAEWGTMPGDDEGGPFPGDVVAKLDGSGTKDTHGDFGRRVRLAGANTYLRTQAISRLFLDNIYSIGASWVTMGPGIGQVALCYGANDLGSIMLEENVVSAAGTTWCLDEQTLQRMICDAGFTPAERNNSYEIVALHNGAEESPTINLPVHRTASACETPQHMQQ